jgi:hypothetical protein
MNMMKIREMVENDLKFEEEKLDHESLRIPQLHSKYLNLLTEEKLTLNKYKTEYSCLYKIKWEYYNGKLSEEELQAKQWEQFDLKILKSDIPIYMNSDKDLILLNEKITLQTEKVNYIESILKMILNRQFHIRDAIAWRKFMSGVI